MQLALAISVSDPGQTCVDSETAQINAVKQISLGRSPSQSMAEFLALRYWSCNVVNYDEKVIDGFYDVCGVDSSLMVQTKMPSLVDLEAISVLNNVDFEVVLVNRVVDVELRKLEERVHFMSMECLALNSSQSTSYLAQKIADLIVERMGGPVSDVEEMFWRWRARSHELRVNFNTVVLPLGSLDIGHSRQRALLRYLLISDRVNLPCKLVKGSYHTGTDDGAVNLIKVDSGRSCLYGKSPGGLKYSLRILMEVQKFIEVVMDLNKCATTIDRISELPDEIIIVILSFLSLREAARTSTLSSRWLDLWKHNPDKISQLPDRIIAVILSSLPLREAASTSVLSSRWLDLWKYTRNLNFTEDIFKSDFDAQIPLSWVHRESKSWDVEKCKYVDLVNSVLQSHKAPSEFRETIQCLFLCRQNSPANVAKWLEFASLKGVERLELDLKCGDPMYQLVLEELLRGSGLRQTDHVNVILFRSLKSLHLNSLAVSGEAIKMLLHNFPLLEALIIFFTTLTSDVEVCGSGATLKLKHLRICCCRGNKSIIVSAPNLVLLMVDETSGKLLLKNVPELVEADIRFVHGNLDEVRHLASEVFCYGSQLKTLRLTLKHPEIFWADGVFPQMPNLNELDVVYSGVK